MNVAQYSFIRCPFVDGIGAIAAFTELVRCLASNAIKAYEFVLQNIWALWGFPCSSAWIAKSIQAISGEIKQLMPQYTGICQSPLSSCTESPKEPMFVLKAAYDYETYRLTPKLTRLRVGETIFKQK